MNIDSKYISKLVSVAKECFDWGEIPVSSCIISNSGKLISICGNSRQLENSVINHAEISCIVEAEKSLGDWRLNGYYLISTLEPCDMCCSVIKECRLDKVFYLVERSGDSIFDDNYISKELISGYEFEKEELRILLTSFFEDRR